MLSKTNGCTVVPRWLLQCGIWYNECAFFKILFVMNHVMKKGGYSWTISGFSMSETVKPQQWQPLIGGSDSLKTPFVWYHCPLHMHETCCCPTNWHSCQRLKRAHLTWSFLSFRGKNQENWKPPRVASKTCTWNIIAQHIQGIPTLLE